MLLADLFVLGVTLHIEEHLRSPALTAQFARATIPCGSKEKLDQEALAAAALGCPGGFLME
jgi:hypothetical protein